MKLAEIRQQIEDTSHEIQAAQQTYDPNKAVGLWYDKLPELQKRLVTEETKVQGQDFSSVHKAVIENETAKIISRWTNIPITKLTGSEKNKTLHFDNTLHQRVIGQDGAVEKVVEAIRRNKAGIEDPPKPIGFFPFLGLTGVGKTELVRSFAAALFDDESTMVRLDMSEYVEKFSVLRLIRAPPSYVDYDTISYIYL